MVEVRVEGACYRVDCNKCGEHFEVPISDLRGILRSVPDEIFLRHALKCICELPEGEEEIFTLPIEA